MSKLRSRGLRRDSYRLPHPCLEDRVNTTVQLMPVASRCTLRHVLDHFCDGLPAPIVHDIRLFRTTPPCPLTGGAPNAMIGHALGKHPMTSILIHITRRVQAGRREHPACCPGPCCLREVSPIRFAGCEVLEEWPLVDSGVMQPQQQPGDRAEATI